MSGFDVCKRATTESVRRKLDEVSDLSASHNVPVNGLLYTSNLFIRAELNKRKGEVMSDLICLENIDFIGGDKYICRVHGADMYIDPEFWGDENAETPVCEAVENETN